MAGSAVRTRSPRQRALRIQALLAEIGTQLWVVSRLTMAMFRMSYDFSTVACLTATAVVIVNGRLHEALAWGGTGFALALGWVAARLARRGIARFRRLLDEEWSTASPDLLGAH